jgi:hypothetical protein
MICDYSSWLAFMVAMSRISHDCLCFEGCERPRIVAFSFPEVCACTIVRVQTGVEYCSLMESIGWGRPKGKWHDK